MFRFLVVLLVVCLIDCRGVDAQGRGRYRRSHRSSSSFGFSIGIGTFPGYGFGYVDPYRFDGFGYDPYRYGSFRAPDLLDDPYFQEQHRYDSHFPGRYPPSRRYPPLGMRSAPPQPYLPRGSAPTAMTLPANPGDLAGQLRSSCQQLARNLSVRRDRDVWMQYLAPDRISQWIATGDVQKLRELLTHYDGVQGNPGLRQIAAMGGFAATRFLLRQYLNQTAQSEVGHPPRLDGPLQSTTPQTDRPAVEELPLPRRSATPNTLSP